MDQVPVNKIILIIVCLGSLVDIFQFLWIARRAYHKLKRAMYNRIMHNIRERYELREKGK